MQGALPELDQAFSVQSQLVWVEARCDVGQIQWLCKPPEIRARFCALSPSMFLELDGRKSTCKIPAARPGPAASILAARSTQASSRTRNRRPNPALLGSSIFVFTPVYDYAFTPVNESSPHF